MMPRQALQYRMCMHEEFAAICKQAMLQQLSGACSVAGESELYHLKMSSRVPNQGDQALLDEVRDLQATVICAVIVNEINVVCTLTEIVVDPFSAKIHFCRLIILGTGLSRYSLTHFSQECVPLYI